MQRRFTRTCPVCGRLLYVYSTTFCSLLAILEFARKSDDASPTPGGVLLRSACAFFHTPHAPVAFGRRLFLYLNKIFRIPQLYSQLYSFQNLCTMNSFCLFFYLYVPSPIKTSEISREIFNVRQILCNVRFYVTLDF